MSDLTEIQSSQSVKLTGADSSGIETAYVNVDTDGSLQSRSIDRSGSGSLTALDTVVTANTQGMSAVNFNVTGTWVGTVRAEGTLDAGATWILLTATDSSQAIFATSTVNNLFKVACGGFAQVRMRMSAYTSGTAGVVWGAGVGTGPLQVWNTNSTSLKASVVGNIASGGTNSGNPVKTGNVYNSALPTPSTGQIVDSQANQFGEKAIQFRNKFSNLTGNATTTVKSGSGRLHGISVNNNNGGGTATIYDNTAGSGTKIATLTFGTVGSLGVSQNGPLFIGPLGAEFATGLTVVTAGSASNDITIYYQ